jgi:hypothetical protein
MDNCLALTNSAFREVELISEIRIPVSRETIDCIPFIFATCEFDNIISLKLRVFD